MIKKTELLEEIKLLRADLDAVEKNYALLVANSPPSTAEFVGRVADLEVKMAKLWAVLVQIDRRGNDAPNKFARRTFGGKGF